MFGFFKKVILLSLFTSLAAANSPPSVMDALDIIGEKMQNAPNGKISSYYKKYLEQAMKPNSENGSNISSHEWSILNDEKKLIKFSENNGSFLRKD